MGKRWIVAILVGGTILGPPLACQSPQPEVDQEETRRLCVLSRTRFVCDIEFRSSAESAEQCGVTPVARSIFLREMTSISLSQLYLEGEPGGQGPYEYNNASAVMRHMNIRECDAHDGFCTCRMSYFDPMLMQIFYDSAGCRRASAYDNHPLYFRSRRCEL